ncbi:MAG: c-type cytochrome, partial [Gammaproteobacteria bacterium]
IRNGVSGTIMPPHSYTDTQTWMLVTYLRSIAVRGVDELPPGDDGRGRQVFMDNCARCHRVGSRGNSLGPNLSDLLSRRSLEYIESSVRDPGCFIVPGYSMVRVVLPNNTRYEGVLMNEDAFSIQLIDSGQSLRAFRKRELDRFDKLQQSLMPPFPEPALRRQALIDILHFIQQSQAGDGQ